MGRIGLEEKLSYWRIMTDKKEVYQRLIIRSNMPICPVCRDTEEVKQCRSIKALPNLISHQCEACKVYWEGRVNNYEV